MTKFGHTPLDRRAGQSRGLAPGRLDRLVDELAGVCGIDPGPFTLRALVRMAEERYRADWARTSTLMALAVNLVRDQRRTPAAKPSDFNPYAPKPKKPILHGKQLEILRDVFVKSSSTGTHQPVRTIIKEARLRSS